MSRARLLIALPAALLLLPAGLSAQSYRVREAGVAATAGHTSSPQYAAAVVGGTAAPVAMASPQYQVRIEPADLPADTGQLIFVASFE